MILAWKLILGWLVKKYWDDAAARGCPWALQEPQPRNRMPVKIFGDDCVYDEQLNKAYGLVLSLPLWRPKSARNSRFLLWAQKSNQFAGFEGLLPLLARMVWSLAYNEPLPKSGLRFAVCEIGGDWSWNRFFGKWIDIGIVTPHAPFATRRSLDLMRIAAWTTFNGCQIQTFCDWSGAGDQRGWILWFFYRIFMSLCCSPANSITSTLACCGHLMAQGWPRLPSLGTLGNPVRV